MDNIRAERARHNITVGELAKVLGISTAALHNRLSGKVDWGLLEAKKMVDFFNQKGSNVTIESLFKDIMR